MKEFGEEVLNLSNMVCEFNFSAHFLSSYNQGAIVLMKESQYI